MNARLSDAQTIHGLDAWVASLEIGDAILTGVAITVMSSDLEGYTLTRVGDAWEVRPA